MNLKLVAIALAISLTSGCESMNKEKMGTGLGVLIGAAGGAAAGGAIAKDKKQGMVIGAIAGAIAGGLIGNKIAQYLTEQDRKKHSEAVSKALETGQPQAWTSPETGNSGQVTVGTTTPSPAPQTPPPSTAPVPQTMAQAPLCRTTTQTIKLKNGETHTEELKACKGPDGTWEAVAA